MVILKAIPVETLVPGGFNCAAQFWTRIQTNHTTSSSGLGVGEGLMSHPLKQVSLLKTRALFKMAGEGYGSLVHNRARRGEGRYVDSAGRDLSFIPFVYFF